MTTEATKKTRMPMITKSKLAKFRDMAKDALMNRLFDLDNGATGDQHGVLFEINSVLQVLFSTPVHKTDWWFTASLEDKDKLSTSFKRNMQEARESGMCVTSTKQNAFSNNIIENPPQNDAEALQYVDATEKHTCVYVSIRRDALIPVNAGNLAKLRANGVIVHRDTCIKVWDDAHRLGAKAKAAAELTTNEFAQYLADTRKERALLRA